MFIQPRYAYAVKGDRTNNKSKEIFSSPLICNITNFQKKSIDWRKKIQVFFNPNNSCATKTPRHKVLVKLD